MDFLDSLLNGQRNNRNQYQRDMMRGFAESRVTAMSEKGIQFATPDTRMSSALARQAVRGSTGMEPSPNMFLKAGDAQGFREANGEAFHRLTAAGIKVGSPMTDVFKALSPAAKSANTSNRPQLGNAQSANRDTATSIIPRNGNDLNTQNRSLDPVRNMQDGYNSRNLNSLNDIQLDTMIQEQHNNFQKLLHSALFDN